MGRKKKTETVFEPSKYQKEIFRFVREGQGNLVVEACAGSGKTYTLLKCLELIDPDKRVLLTAFNRDIVDVLKKKTKNMPNVSAMTLHGLGLLMLQRNYGDERLELDEFKYKTFVNSNISSLSSVNTFMMGRRQYFQYMDNIYKFIDFGRFYLCETVDDLKFIEERYDIDTLEDEKEIAIEAMEWGRENLDTIDYGDMIWLPNTLSCQPFGLEYDWIGLDECQDLNKAQRELLLKCRKEDTRMMSYGDENQCIYSFSGSDPDSFKALKSLPNTTSLPLSISYRCAQRIVAHAKMFVPSIECNDDGRVGAVLHDVNLDNVADNDMILCRNNAPLMQIYNHLIKKGKKCFVRGKDIGNNMIRIIKNTKQDLLSLDLERDGLFPRLYRNLFEARNELMVRSNLDISTAMDSAALTNKLDIICALEILSEDIKTSQQLIDRIKTVFSDKKKGGISLSTIHKAKGLEANNVYIACASLMPNKHATKDWEIVQEHNLMYVAFTRPKNKLLFMSEDEFKPFGGKQQQSLSKLAEIEAKVNYLYGKKSKLMSANTAYASEIIKRAKKIEPLKSNRVVFGNVQKTPQRRASLMSTLQTPMKERLKRN